MTPCTTELELFFNGHWVVVECEVGDGWISPQTGYYDDNGDELTDGELDMVAAKQDRLHMALNGLGGRNPNRWKGE